jgi:cytochrome c-type biogenesis protein CcmE
MSSEPAGPKNVEPKDEADVSPLTARVRGQESPEDEAQRRRGLIMLMTTAGLGAAILFLVFNGIKDNAVYSKPIDELVAQKAKFAGKPVRAEGNLVHGSLEKRDSPCEYRFRISKNGTEVPVRYGQCVVPDTFRDVPDMDVGVTVEGQLQADNSFEATTVLAKCPSKYEMKDRAQRGEQMPHGMKEGSEATQNAL